MKGERNPTTEKLIPIPPILRGEIGKAVNNMDWRKAAGSYGVLIEMVETAGEFGIDKITELANTICRT